MRPIVRALAFSLAVYLMGVSAGITYSLLALT